MKELIFRSQGRNIRVMMHRVKVLMQKKIVWRCINRLDYGKKYCHASPTVEEAHLQDAIMNAVMNTAKINPEILQTLKMHIQMGFLVKNPARTRASKFKSASQGLIRNSKRF